jgi:hypothetical protein
MELRFARSVDVGEGDAVRVGISEALFLRLVWRLYGWPLLAGLAGGWFGHHIGESYGTGRGIGDLLTLAGMAAGIGMVLGLARGVPSAAALAGQFQLLGRVDDSPCTASGPSPGKLN